MPDSVFGYARLYARRAGALRLKKASDALAVYRDKNSRSRRNWLALGRGCGYTGRMPMHSDDAPMRTADLARLAAERAARLRADGAELTPVVGTSRKLAEHFWGSAWMKHLALCESGGLCLAPGRSLLRHGCVLDVRISPGAIHALVSAHELYDVSLHLKPLDDERLECLRALCSGHIGSLVALLEGSANADLLQQLCNPDAGLLPAPGDWRICCSCPDWAEPCPHAAAAIYATGILIDRNPSLLFTLRQVDPASLISLPSSSSASLDPASLAATFGIELDSLP